MTIDIRHGDCLDILKEIEPESIDSCVTDPPAGISIFGNEWDSDKGGREKWIEWMTSVATEVFRVLKPGAHAVVWSIPKTSHWTATAWENAGFGLPVDKVFHIFASGIPPTNRDISKEIDKRSGHSLSWFGPWFHEWRKSKGITQKQVAVLFPSKSGKQTGCLANWELGFNIPTVQQFNIMRDAFDLPFYNIESVEREVISSHGGKKLIFSPGGKKDWVDIAIDVTSPSTDEAKKWEGWGTRLRQSVEEWIIFRKPISKATITENVLTYGTGAINLKSCMINSYDGSKNRSPTNVVHDGSDDVLEAFMDYNKKAHSFFYSAKAGKNDRCGSKHPTIKPISLIRWLCRLVTPPGGTVLDPFAGSGTAASACIAEGFNAILIEKEEEYIADIKRRLEGIDNEAVVI